MREDDRDRVARQGMQAWQRLKKQKSWNDWRMVGEALLVGREWAMNQARTNKPEGKAYNMAIGEWLARYKLDDMDKGDRSRLFAVMDNLPMIEEWRQTLTLSERLKLNHPSAVLRKWKAAVEPEKPKTDKPTLRDSVIALDEENARLKAHIAELEAAREDTPEAAANNPRDAFAVLLNLVRGREWQASDLTDDPEDLRVVAIAFGMVVKAARKAKKKADAKAKVLCGAPDQHRAE